MGLHSLPKELAGSGPAPQSVGHRTWLPCTEKYEARVLISCTHIHMHVCAYTYAHAHTLEGTLTWTHVVHTCTHYTCEQYRQKKQQTQASSETIQMHVPVQIRQHLKVYQGGQLTKPRMNTYGKLNKTKQNKHILAQKTLSLPTSRWLTTHLGYTAYYYPTAAGSLCW